MQTKQIIQSSANVIRITAVKAGDVYKRFDDQYDDRVSYGVITAVHNDGDKTIIQATEYRYAYNSIEIAYKIIKGEKDYTLFPATPEDLNIELGKARAAKVREIEDAKDKIEKSTKIIAEIDGLMSGETQRSLTAMTYKELSQTDYNKKVAELAA